MVENKSTFLVACLNTCATNDIRKNLDTCKAFIQEAGERGVRLTCLPENFAFMGSEKEKWNLLDEINDAWHKELLPLAKQYQMCLIAGGHPERAQDKKVFNVSSFVNSEGQITAIYRKIHLFDIEIPGKVSFRESSYTQGGKDIVVVDSELGKIGLSICYDLRFPELYRAMQKDHVEIISIPAAFTLFTGKDHWIPLLRARAIENQAYVIAAAQWGKHCEIKHSYGHACVIDPWGNVTAMASDREDLVVGKIDLGYLKEVREQLPCLQHRQDF